MHVSAVHRKVLGTNKSGAAFLTIKHQIVGGTGTDDGGGIDGGVNGSVHERVGATSLVNKSYDSVGVGIYSGYPKR